MRTMITVALCAALCAPLTALALASDAGPEQPAADSGAAPADAAATTDASQPAAAPDSMPDNPVDADPVGWAGKLYTAIRSGEWLPVIGILMFFFVALARFGLGKLSSWFEGKIGGYVIALSSAFLLTFGLAFAANDPPSLALLGVAVSTAWVAAGGRKTALDVFSKLTKKD